MSEPPNKRPRLFVSYPSNKAKARYAPVEDIEMDDDDSMDVGDPYRGVENPGAPESGMDDDDDDCDARSAASDSPDEVLVEEDDDDIVPRSFCLSSPTHSSSSDGDRFAADEILSPPSPKLCGMPSAADAHGVYGSDRLQHYVPLFKFGYALNESVKAVICTSCHCGVPLDMLVTHSKRHHKGRSFLSSAENDTVTKDLRAAGYLNSKDTGYNQPPGQKPVDGLQVLTGYLCPVPRDDGSICALAFRAESTFSRHLSSHSYALGDVERPIPSMCVSSVQTLFGQGGLQGVFSVQPSLSHLDPSSSSAYSHAVKLLQDLPKADFPIPDHDKDQASISWFTRWPELLKPYAATMKEMTFLRSLVSFPEPSADPQWLMGVQDHGLLWWQDAEKAHSNCSYNASVALKSHKKYLGHWKVLREQESARRYCGTAISFVSFCLRAFLLPDEKHPARFTLKQREALQHYKEQLMVSARPSSGDIEKFQRVLFCVLFREEASDVSVAGRLSCPVQCYISLLSLRKHGHFVKPGLVTQPISRLMYLSRAAVLKKALATDSGDGGFMDTLQRLCESFLGTGEGKVMDELITLQKHAGTLAAKEPGDPNILYDPDYTSISYRGRNLPLAKLQSGLNDLIEETWGLLLALSGGKKINVEVPARMSEDVRSTTTGDSFINSIRTQPETLPLLHEMSRSTSFPFFTPRKSTDDSNAFEINPGAVEEFLHEVKPIVEAIAFLVHFTGSGPLRLSEVVEDRFSNGSGPRNLLISHGYVFLLRRNLKTSGIRGLKSSIIHFPSKKVSDLIVYYLAVVRPLEIFLTGHLQWKEEHSQYSQFLYVVKGKKLGPQDLSKIIARHTDRYLECKLTGLEARHVLISIQTVFLPPIVDPSVQKIGDSQAGHKTVTANWVYSQRWDHLPGNEATTFPLVHHWCKKLHTVLGVGPEATPVRPIPYIYAPPESTWWTPSDYVPPQPPSPHELMGQVHHMVNSALSSASHQFSITCEKVVRETVLKTLAGSFASNPPAQITAVEPPPVASKPSSSLSTSDSVSFQHAITPIPQNTTPAPSISIPASSLGSHRNPAQAPRLRPPPTPSSTAIFNAYAAQSQATARKAHAESVERLMERLGGCYACRLGSADYSPCHEACGRSGSSGCSVNPHHIFTCTSFEHNYGWIDWKKNFKWPGDISRCYFCGLPSPVAGVNHGDSGKKFPGRCQFSDTAVAAAWHVLNTEALFNSFKLEFKVPSMVPDKVGRAQFAVWLTEYESPSADIRLLSLFSWLDTKLRSQ